MKLKIFIVTFFLIVFNFILFKETTIAYADSITHSLIILEEDKEYKRDEISQLYNKVITDNGEIITVGSWPIKGYTYISSNYGNRIHPITKELKHHRGIDIPASYDTDITSIDDGEVIFSGFQNGYGNVVIIKHKDSKVSLYAHNNKNLVNVYDKVKRGQVIAKVGSTGLSTGPHLHLEIKINNINVDPSGYIDIDESKKLANNI